MENTQDPSQKLVHWDMNGPSLLSDPSLSFLSSQDYEATSALQYINTQLVAHGFARSPGLSLDALSNSDSERLVKCLLGMLSQRMEDLGRTEELSSRLRKLTYEHERLESMHHTSVDHGASAEREMNLFKSKLTASQKSLASETSAHKQTSAELQRTRTSLQYLRSTTQNELKRKDKEFERVLDRWNKVVDAQVKLSSAQCGLRCANLAVGNDDQVRSKGLLEEALEQAEEARSELVRENDGFRTVLLGTANALQGIVYKVKSLGPDVHLEEPTPISHLGLFAPPTSSLSQPDNAHAKLHELISTFREAFSSISSSSNTPPTTSTQTAMAEKEINKLKEVVASLHTELETSRQSLTVQAQALLDRFTAHASERLIFGRGPTPAEAADMSMELIGVPERDELREKLEERTKELEKERERFTEAAVKLGKEKAALEAERVKFLEEKRRWTVEQMLAELPPTPGPDPGLASPPHSAKTKAKHISCSPPRVRQRKPSGPRACLGSPSKKIVTMKRAAVTVGQPEAHVVRKTLGMRRESAVFQTLEVLYDPEGVSSDTNGGTDPGLQRSTTPEDSPPVTAPVALAAEMKSSLPLVLPTMFTLPPPSPASSFIALDLGNVPTHSSNTHQRVPCLDTIPLAATPAVVPLPRSRVFASPRTPRHMLNPHLKHAYSPARPSPLSRMLMLADSPPSPPVPAIREEDEDEDSDVGRPLPTSSLGAAAPKWNLGQELVAESPVDEPSPLRERTGENLNGSVGVATTVAKETGEERRFTAKEKGKGRAVPGNQGRTAAEKENVILGSGKAKPQVSASVETKVKPSKLTSMMKKPTGSKPSSTKNITVTKTLNEASGPLGGTSRSANGNTGSMPVARPGGARRVPMGSANATKLGPRRS